MYEDFFANRITALRISKGVSARDMSLSLGQSESYINKIENGKSFPSMQVFFYICQYFDISPKEFFDDKNENPVLIRSITENLLQLDEKIITNIGELVRELTK